MKGISTINARAESIQKSFAIHPARCGTTDWQTSVPAHDQPKELQVNKVTFDPSWPESVKLSNFYDELELWGSRSDLGYTYGYQNRFTIAMDLIKSSVAPPARVLDLAAAQGNFSLSLAELGYEVVWNDLRADLVDYVRHKHDFGKIDYLPGNVFDLATEEVGSFDVVLATEIIEHVAHPDDFLRKLALFLRPNGVIVLTTPNGAYFRNHLPRFSECVDPSRYEAVQFRPNSDGHIFLPYCDELQVWAGSAHLRVEQLILFNNPLTKGHIKTGALLPLLPQSIVAAFEAITRKLPHFFCSRINTSIAALLRRPA